MVGRGGFEPPVSCSQSRRDAWLRYRPPGSYLTRSAGRPSAGPRAGVVWPYVLEELTPDLTVLDAGGQTVRLRDLAAGKALVIVFIRHFG